MTQVEWLTRLRCSMMFLAFLNIGLRVQDGRYVQAGLVLIAFGGWLLVMDRLPWIAGRVRPRLRAVMLWMRFCPPRGMRGDW